MNQYDNPIQCYSEDALKEMAEKGTWKQQNLLAAGGAAQFGPGAQAHEPQKFTPANSAVLAVLRYSMATNERSFFFLKGATVRPNIVSYTAKEKVARKSRWKMSRNIEFLIGNFTSEIEIIAYFRSDKKQGPPSSYGR